MRASSAGPSLRSPHAADEPRIDAGDYRIAGHRNWRPVWRALKVDLNASLRSGGRATRDDGGLYLTRHRLRALLVVSELALSLILLVGAGLLIRSFARLASVPPGFNTNQVLSMRVVAAGAKYQGHDPVAECFREIESRVARIPGVRSEGLVSVLPLTGAVGWGGVGIEGYTPPPGQELQVDIRIASPDYFRTMGIPLVKGRFFTAHDTPAASRLSSSTRISRADSGRATIPSESISGSIRKNRSR